MSLVGSLLIVGFGLLQTSLWLFEAGLKDTLRGYLQAEAEGLLIAMVRGPNGVQLDASRINPRYQHAFSGSYFRISLPDRTWRSRSLWDSLPDWPEKPGLGSDLLDGPQHQRLITYRGEYRRGNLLVNIDVAQNYTPILDSFNQVRLGSLGLVAAALLILLFLQGYAMKSALRPLEQARRQIAQLQHGKRRLLDDETPEELQPLVKQINHLLTHTEATLKRSRHALGNLGHALKTPLAVLNNLILHDEIARHPDLQANLREQLTHIEKRVSLELGRARLAAEVLPGTYFECDEELPALFKTLSMIHGQALDLSWQAHTGCHLPRDREDMLELLGNLLDNACKWAKSKVMLEISQTSDNCRILIDDDGPGIAPELREQAMNRGTRLDERPAGHGLGMDIVNDIVNAWHGTWILEKSPLGGLRVRLELPFRQLEN
nr:sensor histidine kinase [Azomonas macrocytogenes]